MCCFICSEETYFKLKDVFNDLVGFVVQCGIKICIADFIPFMQVIPFTDLVSNHSFNCKSKGTNPYLSQILTSQSLYMHILYHVCVMHSLHSCRSHMPLVPDPQ